ncbi:DUF418 domain-containing protein [Aestuariimicrobium ganziense]|uniref:DUF418 domain-containing protein n=1 Tax=Aestuariimicrobium ganziense TaxID=2773677 RepID=UPI001941D090|nr:DUF418 domain-containing protein [Aestuariimicrobium ganziense]
MNRWRSDRLPTPDIARGFMLLLIALANVESWTSAASAAIDRLDLADRVWLVLRTGFVDTRSYPLFTFLIGFGLAVMSRRWPAAVLRRRGWWMIAFGAMHALVFPADILGGYGFVVVLFAGAVVARRKRVLGVFAIVTGLVALVVSGSQSSSAGFLDGLTFLGGWPVGYLVLWATASAGGPWFTWTIATMVLGIVAADRGWLADVGRHRVRFAVGAAAGLGLGFLLSLPVGLRLAGWMPGGDDHPWWAAALNSVGSPLSSFGWVCFAAVLAARVPRPTGLLTATGRRSLTVYLSQSVLFLLVFGAARLLGVIDWFSPWRAAVVAVLAWLVLAWGCRALATRDEPGPLDHLLRVAFRPPAALPPTPAVWRPPHQSPPVSGWGRTGAPPPRGR